MLKRIPYILVGKRRKEIKQQFRLMNLELMKARKMQMALLRQHDLQIPPSIDAGVMLKQSRSVGGDLYMFTNNGDYFRFFIADVCGKGMTAALYMSAIHHILITIDENESTAEYCNILNKELCKLNIDGMFMTMFAGKINIKTGEGTYVNAGHMYPIRWNDKDKANYLNVETDVPIGVIEDYQYEGKPLKLNINDSIILYTDGVIDSINEKDEIYGKKRLVDTINKCKSRIPADIISKVSKDIKIFNNHVPQSDDMILMIIRYNGDDSEKDSLTPHETINQIAVNPNENIKEIQFTF